MNNHKNSVNPKMRFVDRSDIYSVFTLTDEKEYHVTGGHYGMRTAGTLLHVDIRSITNPSTIIYIPQHAFLGYRKDTLFLNSSLER